MMTTPLAYSTTQKGEEMSPKCTGRFLAVNASMILYYPLGGSRFLVINASMSSFMRLGFSILSSSTAEFENLRKVLFSLG